MVELTASSKNGPYASTESRGKEGNERIWMEEGSRLKEVRLVMS